MGRLGLTSTTGGYRLQWTPEAPSLALAIADPGESLAAGAVRVQVSDQGVLTGDSAGTPWTVLARRDGDHVVIDLITTRLAGAPLLMRVDRADRPDPRWWWTRTWRLVAGAR